MKRVVIIVEGQTEESFVAGPLYKALVGHNIFVKPILIGTPGHRGGFVNYDRVRSDLLRTLKQDNSVYCTTLFDLYGLGKGFPYSDSGSSILSGSDKAQLIEEAIL